MKISELKQKINTFTEDERVTYLDPLLTKIFSNVSKSTIHNFQASWDSDTRSFEDFIKEQNKVILECIDIELSSIGKAVRKQLGLEELTEDTEIE